jgi:hypothetical protein
MPTGNQASWLLLTIINAHTQKAFKQLTGMTLDQWDELHYERVMCSDG